jgi:hypothetical protein
MKYSTAAIAAFALVNNVSAVKLQDIFDAYDAETMKEAKNKDRDVNLAELTQEIQGDKIKAEVTAATADVRNA